MSDLIVINLTLYLILKQKLTVPVVCVYNNTFTYDICILTSDTLKELSNRLIKMYDN